MTVSGDPPREYRITVQGECGALLATVIDRIEIESCQEGATRVVVSVRDDSEFWGVMDRFQDLALHVTSVYELRGDADLAGSDEAGAAGRTVAAAGVIPATGIRSTG